MTIHRSKFRVSPDVFDAKMMRLPDESLELVSFTATGTITYEDPEKEFEGGLLYYDLANEKIIVHSDGINPCRLNGMAVDNIEVNIETQQIKANPVASGTITIK